MYPIPLVPGPTRVPAPVLEAFARDYPASDLEPEFAVLYRETESRLQRILGTANRVAVMTGEGMVALWGALKSVARAGDRVLAVSTGLFGEGLGQMAEGLGCDVAYDRYGPDEVASPERVAAAARAHRAELVTLVHCETPSGTLNPLGEIGAALRAAVPEALLCVDAVASAAGAELRVDDWGVDLCLVGSQKALSCPPDAAMVAVSGRAWERIARVGYAGYDALLPWREVGDPGSFPYTPSWHATAAIHAACGLVLEEGVERVIERHAHVAALCRRLGQEIGLRLFPREANASAPTVTAFHLPDGWSWERFDAALRHHGLVVGGSWGELHGRIFRVGHMGDQAREDLVRQGMDVIARVLA